VRGFIKCPKYIFLSIVFIINYIQSQLSTYWKYQSILIIFDKSGLKDI